MGFSLVGLLCLVVLPRCFCVLPLSPSLFPTGGALPTLDGNGIQTTGGVGLPTFGVNGVGGSLPGGALSRNGLRFLVPNPSPSASSSPIASPSSSPTVSTPSSSSSSPPSQTSGSSTPSCSATQTLLVGVCVECSDRINGCTACSTNDDNSVSCNACVSGLTPANGGQSCMSGPDCAEVVGGCENCVFQNDQVECTDCLPGLQPSGASCISGPDCDAVLPGCGTCALQNGQVECTQCGLGFTEDPDNPSTCIVDCEFVARCGECVPDGVQLLCSSCSFVPVSIPGIECNFCSGEEICNICVQDAPGQVSCSKCADVPVPGTVPNPPPCSFCRSLTRFRCKQ